MIEPPNKCPSCDSTLEWSNDQLYCRNNQCPAKSSKQLEHFAKTLKIKGLGPSTIDRLDIYDIFDVYDLSLEYIEAQLNSEKLAIKLFNEIERSKTEPLNTVLPAFGISLIGNSATAKLAGVADSIFDIDEDVCKKAGLGPVATKNLIKWLESNLERYCELPFSFDFEKVKSTGNRGIVCISGKLNSFKTKAEATKVLESLGYTVKGDLTKDVTILVNESGKETAKTEKARNNGVTIVNNLLKYIGE